MRHFIKLIFVLIFFMPVISMGKPMEKIPLEVSIKCTDNPSCIYGGTEIPVEIIIRNDADYEIGYPQLYIQARGPTMKLIDNLSGAEKILKVGLANHDLKSKFTTLAPNETLSVTSVIRTSELTSLRKEYVDLTLEVGVSANVKVRNSDEPEKYQGRARIRIIGKDTLERGNSIPYTP